MTRPLLRIAETCRFNEGVTPPWERLAAAVTARRIELGHPTMQALVDNSDLKLRTLGDIENARKPSYSRGTLATLERALRWATGSVDAVLEGREPVDASAALPGLSGQGAGNVDHELPEDALIKVIDSDLPSAVKAEIVRTVLAEQRRYAQRRVDELLRDAAATQP